MFFHKFLQAAVAQPIIGMDFLHKYSFSIDLKQCKVFFHSPPAPAIVFSAPPPPPEAMQLLREFPNVTADPPTWPTPKHAVKHFLCTSGPPLSARARRLTPAQLKVAKDEFMALERLGIIRRSSSPWASPLHLVPKADSSWRPCGDYRRLNNVTVPDQYPLPNLQDLSANLHGCKVFSKLDLVKGYH